MYNVIEEEKALKLEVKTDMNINREGHKIIINVKWFEAGLTKI